jgi:hypothetical protein
MTPRAAGEPAEGEAMTEAKQQEAGRARFPTATPIERGRARGRTRERTLAPKCLVLRNYTLTH